MTLDECRGILGIGRHADAVELKRAKRRLLVQYHPDQNPQDREWAEEQTRQVLHAYDIILAHLQQGCDAPEAPYSRTRSGYSAGQPRKPAPRTQSQPEHKELHYVLAKAAGQLLGLPLQEVVQVMPLKADSIRAHGAGKAVGWAGSLVFEDQLIPLVDLGVVVTASAESLSACKHFVVMRGSGGSVAVAVQEVRELVAVNAAAIEPAEAVFRGMGDHVKGFFRYEKDYAVIPDLDALLG